MKWPLFFRKQADELEWIGGRYTWPHLVRIGDLPVRPEVVLWLEQPGGLLLTTKLVTSDLDDFVETLDAAMKDPGEGPPRRPTRIRVPDKKLAEAVREAFPEIPVKVARVPELDDIFAQLVEETTGTDEEPSYLGDGSISPAVVAKLFEAASLLARAAPWRYVTERQILNVEIPLFGFSEGCLCVVGNAGESFAIMLFRSIEDYDTFVMDGMAGSHRSREIVLRSLSLDRKKDLHPALMREIEQHRWPVAGTKAYPTFFCVDAEKTAVPFTDRDLRMMTACTHAFLDFFARHRDLFAADSVEPASESGTTDGVTVTLTGPYDGEPEIVLIDPEGVLSDHTPVRSARTAGRNDPCPCGSGKKYKKCHLDADRASGT